MPLEPLEYDIGARIEVATLPGPGCLSYDYRRIGFVPSGRAGCGVEAVARQSPPMEPPGAPRPASGAVPGTTDR